MKIIFALLALFLFLGAANAVDVFTIDTFSPNLPAVQVTTESAPDPNTQTNGAFQVGDNVIGPGNQRDIFLTITAAPFVVAFVSMTGGTLGAAYAQESDGIVRVCWDGDGDSDFMGPNPSPGLGGIDLTTDGAFAFVVDITTDHEVEYTFTILTGTERSSFLLLVPDVGDDAQIQTFSLPYAGFTGTGDFSNVDAIELLINFNISGAIDTGINIITVFSYELCGHAFQDCDSDGVEELGESALQGMTVNLSTPSNPTILEVTFTDFAGDFCFTGFPNGGTFRVCVVDETGQGHIPTVPATGCLDATLVNFQDVVDLLFGLTITSTVTAPVDVTLNCNESTQPSNTGFATSAGCTVGSVTFTDSTSGVCPTVITRTWTSGGASDVQFIRVDDTVAPFFAQVPQDEASDCASSDINDWVNRNADAVCNDQCSAVNNINFSNNWDGSQPGQCGSVSVAFTCIDECGNASTDTATYSTFDNIAPAINPQASNEQADCANDGSDTNAYNVWLASNGGSNAADNCGGFSVTNNANGVTSPSCVSTDTVTFTYSDNCGNVSFTTATFTISDNEGPQWVVDPSDDSAECATGSGSAYQAWLDANGNGFAQDNCGTATISNNSPSAPTGCAASQTVTFTASDNCFNTVTRTATFSVVDTQPPTITQGSQNLSVSCAANDAQNQINTWLATAGGATTVDACLPGVSITNNYDGATADCSSELVTFEICDTCGNCANTAATLSIDDTTAPVLSEPTDPTVQCDSNAQTTFDNYLASNGFTNVFDDCSPIQGITVSNNVTNTNIPTGCSTSTFVQFIAVDLCGNVATQVGIFSVVDTALPTLTSPPASVDVECSGTQEQDYDSWRASNGGAIATDVCGSAFITNDAPADFPFDCDSALGINFTVQDTCGNSFVTTASYRVRDTTPPTIVQEAQDFSDECGSDIQADLNQWLNSNANAIATDNCSSVTFTNNFTALSGGCTQASFVTFVATDACGNAVTTAANFSVDDTAAPIITTPAANQAVDCDSDTQSSLTQWLNTAGGAQATDLCQDDNQISLTNNFNTVLADCDSETVTFTFTDLCGQSVSTTASFSVLDNSVPTFPTPAQDQTVECDGNGNVGSYNAFVNSRAGAVAQDDCALQLTFTNNAPATGPTTCASQAVTFTVSDECGNSASTSAVFTVADTTAPLFVVSPNNQAVQCDLTQNPDQLSAFLQNQGGATIADTCDSDPTISTSAPSITGDSCNNVSEYTFTAVDQCGQTSSATATFTVFDSLPPTFTQEPEDVVFECDGAGNNNDINAWLASNGNGATATDSCNSVTITNDFTTAPNSCQSVLVNFFATDACNNVVATDALLTIDDSVAPSFVNFPVDVEIPCDSDFDPSVTGSPDLIDICWDAASLTLSSNDVLTTLPATGDCPGDIEVLRTFLVTDPCGNTFSQDQLITINIARSSGPCDPTDCVCDNCCPLSEAVDCLPVDCDASACNSAPCQPVDCVCSSGKNVHPENAVERLNMPLPQCEPVYVYVYDDDDSNNREDDMEKPHLVSGEDIDMGGRRTRRTRERLSARKALPAVEAENAKSWFDELFA